MARTDLGSLLGDSHFMAWVGIAFLMVISVSESGAHFYKEIKFNKLDQKWH